MPDSFTLHIAVTADDIAKGKPQVSGLCPVALAIRRAHPHTAIVHAMPHMVYLRHTPAGDTWVAKTPDDASHFMWLFDHKDGSDGVGQPFECDLTFYRKEE